MKSIAGMIAGIFAILIAAGCNSSASGQPDFTSKVDQLIDSAQTTNKVPSICVAIGRKGNVTYTHCAGLIDVNHNIPATPTSIYQIASVTKQFTSAAIMILANQNPPALSLTDPVSKYVPELATDPGITIESLMNMSAGLVDYITLPQAPEWFSGVAPLTVINALAPLPLGFPSGTAFEYVNSDPFVLGVVIENISGMSYGDFIQTRLLAPNGLTSTSYGPSPTGANAIGYTRDDSGNLVQAVVIDPSATFAAGALSSDVMDIVKWDGLLLGGKILPADEVRQMTTPPPITGSSHAEPSVYGYGLVATDLYRRPIVMHGGRVPGFNNITSTFTDTGWSISVMSNIDVRDYLVDGLWRQILHTVCAPGSLFRPEC
ncbi:MAG: serine hydrolase domain-containing protein [Candidatus Binataceae bacterium]